MVSWPSGFDNDATIPRIDDNLSEIGGEVINNVRDAIFALQAELGLNPSGSSGSVANFLLAAHNPDGTIKASALTSVGLATLPIVDNQVASNAGIKESKLSLDHNTADLFTSISANSTLLNSLSAFTTATNSDLLTHIAGGNLLSDGVTKGRHVASHIDINAVPSDSRDSSFSWSGLIDKDGNKRSAANVAKALEQINDALTVHENSDTEVHPATAVSVDTDDFTELPQTISNVQEALDAIDDTDRLQIGVHRAVQHSNGIPPTARSQSFINPDGYSSSIVPSTKAFAYLVKRPETKPVDSTNTGDDVVKFLPDNSNFIFDSQFALVKPGDIIRINYGGIEGSFPINEKRHTPGSEWFVRLNGVNLANRDGYDGYDGYAYARIDRPKFDNNTYGVLAVASANNDIDPSIQGSAIVTDPRAASALGLGFDPNKIDSSHYNLYLQLYPTGKPEDRVITLPAIDVTGNQGSTPGQYTLDTLIKTTNNAFRSGGYNYRFVAFGHDGQFGIKLADSIGGAAFSIVSGELSGATLIEGSFTNNIIGDALDNFDALGFGANKANIASPQYITSFSSGVAALNPTKVISPLKQRNYIVNGVRRDTFAATPFATDDGYWDAEITNRTIIGSTTVETEYTVNFDLSTAGLEIGKTLVVQPSISFSDAAYSDNDYGRFVIKSVNFNRACPTDPIDKTIITVINSVHADSSPTGFSSGTGLNVRIHFGEDSVSFNSLHLVNNVAPGVEYNRLHEIFVDEDGNTFSHERARMPKQSSTSLLLDTNDRWTIRDISSKLRGFPDSSFNNLRRFVRFFVLSYNSTTGEYDGYIGNPSGSSIEDFGKVVTGRKNVPVRFYDSSNVDYMDIEFFDESSDPGIDIMSSNLPRYVDIEIFPSLSNNDEFLRLATCELDDNVVERVTDRRDFGSISEKDLTDSLINYIAASDKFIHENAPLRGLDFISVSSSDDRLLNFQGGVALVNGKVVPVNDGSVAIPEIWQKGTTKPTTVEWAVCVNEHGNFEPIIITNSKDQFFATIDNVNSYYVPSTTFSELVNKRKDLTLIATVTASISSISLAVRDARRILANSGFNSFFTLSEDGSDQEFMFTSIEPLKEWINGTGMNQIMVSGNIIIDSVAASNWPITSMITYFYGYHSSKFVLSDSVSLNVKNAVFDGVNFDIGSNSTLTTGGVIVNSEIDGEEGSKIVLEGGARFEDSVMETVSLIGVELSRPEDMVIRRVNIDYNPSNSILPSFTSGDHINADQAAALIYSNGENIENLIIEDCILENAVDNTSQAPACILIKINNGDVVDRLKIRSNYFEGDHVAPRNAAIAIVSSNASSTGSGAIVVNSEISHNKCNHEQGIYIVASKNNGDDIDDPGIHVLNSIISNNICGVIGYNTSDDSGADLTNADINLSGMVNSFLTIKENTVKLIIPSNEIGTDQSDLGSITHTSGRVIIKENNANWIKFLGSGAGTGVISSNLLIADDTSFVEDYIQASSVADGYAIAVLGVAGGASVEIINNYSRYAAGAGFGYKRCIYADLTTSIISNNLLSGVESGGYLIYITNSNSIVTNNSLNRLLTNISKYIYLRSFAYAEVVDNALDTATINGSDTSVFDIDGNNTLVERNINQTKTLEVPATSGIYRIGTGSSVGVVGDTGSLTDSRINVAVGTYNISMEYGDTGTTVVYARLLALDDILPDNVKVISISVDAALSGGTMDTTGVWLAALYSGLVNFEALSSLDFTLVTSGTSSLTVATPDNFITKQTTPELSLGFTANDSSSNTLTISSIQITYRW